ncbi:hypothetical protein BDW22DRAFT_1417420 [Trametopsis cervina]|nr:hypothetical protein BDW22DRAFT_1417420 [Trametopsis cervina]
MLRQTEYNRMFEAAALRLGPVYDRLLQELNKPSIPGLVKERYDRIVVLLGQFSKVNLTFDEEYQGKLTHSQWRRIKRDLKAIGRCNLSNLDTNWDNAKMSENIVHTSTVDAHNVNFEFSARIENTSDAALQTRINQTLTAQELAQIDNATFSIYSKVVTILLQDRQERMIQFIQDHTEALLEYINNVAQEVYGEAPALEAFNALRVTVTTQQESLNNILSQVNALPATAGSHSTRQPKIAEPPSFEGADGKTTLQEWLNMITLWNHHEGIATDKQRIVMALSRLGGAAHKYMGSYYERLERGNDVGTWDEFRNELISIYGQRDDKEGAKKELEQLFANKDLANKNLVKYAERFRTLARLSGYEDGFLIDKLRLVVSQEMRMCLIGLRNNTPTRWQDFLDILLEFYKELHPERVQGKIFAKGSRDESVPMEVDNADKKKGNWKNKKGKEVNSAEKSKHCAICNRTNHSTSEHRNKPQPDQKKDERGKSKAQFGSQRTSTSNSAFGKKKIIRTIEVEVTDDEAESSTPSSAKQVNTMRVESTVRIEDLPDEDEHSDALQKAKPFDPADFRRRFL